MISCFCQCTYRHNMPRFPLIYQDFSLFSALFPIHGRIRERMVSSAYWLYDNVIGRGSFGRICTGIRFI